MLPESITNLIEQFSKLPGVGPKTAGRLTFYLLTKPKEDVNNLGQALLGLHEKLCLCEDCFNFATDKKCQICQSSKRNKAQIMIVSEPLDIVAMEKTEYNGAYHVLGGVISPIDGVGPENLRISQILSRIKSGAVKELILATDPSLEGEATAMFIQKTIGRDLPDLKIKITRIARGLPVGGDLEYADEETLSQAFEGRREY